MKRYILVGFASAGITIALMLMGQALVSAQEQPAAASKMSSREAALMMTQPDTNSPNWKALSDDLGIWILKDDQIGLQGRLYVRFNNAWVPVGVQGSRDFRGIMPVR